MFSRSVICSVLICATVSILELPSWATIPARMNYQGILTDTGGTPITSTVPVIFTIWDAPAAGNVLWTELQSVTPNSEGLFNVTLGSGIPIPDSAFSFGAVYLGTTVGADPELSPRQQLLTVAYAVVAVKSDTAGYSKFAGPSSVNSGAIIDGTIQLSDIGQNGATPGQIIKWNGTAWEARPDSAGAGPSGWIDDGTVVRLAAPSDFVGMGTLAPGERLHVIGNALVSGKATIGSGNVNGGTAGFVAGGNNRLYGSYATVTGGGGSSLGDSNSAIGTISVVGGGRGNVASGDSSVVVGGTRNIASGAAASVLGGFNNLASGEEASVLGGRDNVASGLRSVIGGGGQPGGGNTASNSFSAVLAGTQNLASGISATVCGGGGNKAEGDESFIGGGGANFAGPHATVGGGSVDSASGRSSVIGGGNLNVSSGYLSSLLGGISNRASGDSSFVGGGHDNSGTGRSATVSGGSFNTASGAFSTVAGGRRCRAAGDYSFAAGTQAKALHAGTFVLTANDPGPPSDSVYSSGVEQFVVRADGGFYLTDAAGAASIPAGRFLNTSTGGYLTTGGTWTNSSDRNAKENITPVSADEVLQRLTELPISEWNYRREDPSVRHIGPMAQDFRAQFGTGTDSISISTIDADGVALAAIQALSRRNAQLEATVARLNEEMQQVRMQLRAVSK